MTLRWILAALHLLALGIGFGSIWARGRALHALTGSAGLKRVFLADTFWGISAMLWISTGLWRAFGGGEKGTAYYMGDQMFRAKMTMLAIILLLEIWPMVTLVRWRIAEAKGVQVDLSRARTFARISDLQALLVVAMVFAATAMARGMRL